MRTMLLMFLVAGLLLLALTLAQLAEASEYTTRQRVVIDLIYQACDRYGVTDEQCALPLYVAWRETKYGQTIYSAVDVYNGVSTSVGVFQWYAGPRGNCIGGGAGCSGEYFKRCGLAWRGNLWMDIDRGVEMLTSHMRGGPDYRGHWRAWQIGAWPGRPGRE